MKVLPLVEQESGVCFLWFLFTPDGVSVHDRNAQRIIDTSYDDFISDEASGGMEIVEDTPRYAILMKQDAAERGNEHVILMIVSRRPINKHLQDRWQKKGQEVYDVMRVGAR